MSMDFLKKQWIFQHFHGFPNRISPQFPSLYMDSGGILTGFPAFPSISHDLEEPKSAAKISGFPNSSPAFPPHMGKNPRQGFPNISPHFPDSREDVTVCLTQAAKVNQRKQRTAEQRKETREIKGG